MTGKQPHRSIRGVAGRLACLGMAGLLAWIAAGVAARDQAPALPEDLALIPVDAHVVVSARPADLWNHPVIQSARQKVGKDLARPMAEFEQSFGAAPEHVERLTVVHMANAPDSDVLMVALNRPYDRARVQALAGPGARPEMFKGRILFVGTGGRAAALIGPKAYAWGRVEPLKSLLDRPATEKSGPLTDARQRMLEKHALVVGANMPALAAELGENLPPHLEPFKPLLAAKAAVLVADFGEQAQASLVLPFAGADAAARGAKPLKAAVDFFRTALAEDKKRILRQGIGLAQAKVYDLADRTLKDAVVEQDGATLRATTRLKVDAAALAAGVAEVVREVSRTVPRIQSQNNLRQLILAIHNYLDTYGRLPPVAVFDKSGKPILSWRVLILPFLDQDALYREFHLDEPWDGEHNKKLLERMPPVYAAPGQKKSTQTYYLAFWGKGAAFEGKKPLRFPTDFPDGTSNTIMFAEAARAVPWSKAEELDYDPDKPPPPLGGLFEDGFHAAFCDGSVRFLRKTIKPSTLHLLIQRNDGQVIPGDF
jgi:hypothetical protein